MEDRTLHRWAGIIGGGAVLSLILIVVSAFIYPNYDYGDQFLSAIGRTFFEKDGVIIHNLTASVIFNTGVFISGISTILFFYLRGKFGGGIKFFRYAASAMGILGGTGLVGISLTPFNLHPDLHNFCTLAGIILFFALLFNVCTSDGRFTLRGTNLVWLAMIIEVGLTFLAFAHQQNIVKTLPAYPTGPLLQKMAVCAYGLYMIGQCVTVRILTAKDPSRSSAGFKYKGVNSEFLLFAVIWMGLSIAAAMVLRRIAYFLFLMTPGFLLYNLIHLIRVRARLEWLAWLGLAATMIGDYFLVYRGVGRNNPEFLMGVAGFSIAQIFLITYFGVTVGFSRKVAAGAFLIAAVVLAFAYNLIPIYLTAALVAYALFSSVSLSGAVRAETRWFPAAVGLLFFSDINIALTWMDVPGAQFVCSVTYIAFLVCLASALSVIGSKTPTAAE